ncbi:cysteine desulfurase family protein [Dyadobacter sp. CY312]|uniref:cysteine desulfurase family protein n=1 Tax=Dyadobacter sp. CY312 TaxID=2907303 RepID=UPI001F37B035|nr:cysteine desulfurase family protein [Dyadobacter sp. CY312]MCE7040954.1 cysteine desulfurase [Dyadobacter sp. CY312]
MPIYLDNNATTPMDPRVLEEMLPYFLNKFGNAASRTHAYGWEAEEAVEHGRENIANLIGANPNEIVFTSGATEAINLAIKGIFESSVKEINHIITVQTEHKAVLDTCRSIEKRGAQVTYLPVDVNGLISLQELQAAITKDTLLIAVMFANNETGVIQPVREIGEIAVKHGIHFFTDATQAVGKIPVNVKENNVALMAFSAHKLYGPKGIGALFVRKKNGPALTAQIDGGGHERNRRSGTLNVPGIVGLGKACELAEAELTMETERLTELRNQLESRLSGLNIVINATSAPRLPHCTNITFNDIDGEKLILEASSRVAFSQSSACTSATIQPSHVLKAMGLTDEIIHNSFRLSLGRFTTSEQVDMAIEVISKIVKSHQSERN